MENAHRVAATLNDLHALLMNWNAFKGLVSRQDVHDLWTRHVEDSLQLVPLIGRGVLRSIDIGSGAGFPGLVIAIATGIHVELFESNKQKAAFLREAIRVTGTTASVQAYRAEDSRVPPAALVTARGVAALPSLLASAASVLTKGGTCLFPKGAGFETELRNARVSWRFRVERVPSRTSKDGVILRLSDIARR